MCCWASSALSQMGIRWQMNLVMAFSLVFLAYGFISGIISSCYSLYISRKWYKFPAWSVIALNASFFRVIVFAVCINVSHLISFPQIPIIQSKEKQKDSKPHLANTNPGSYPKSWVPSKEVNNHLLSCAFDDWREFELPMMLVFWSKYILQLRIREFFKWRLCPWAHARSIVGAESLTSDENEMKTSRNCAATWRLNGACVSEQAAKAGGVIQWSLGWLLGQNISLAAENVHSARYTFESKALLQKQDIIGRLKNKEVLVSREERFRKELTLGSGQQVWGGSQEG